MTRNITSAFRELTESSFRDEVDLCFLTITHDDLAEPIRVVWDTKDFVYGGETFIGFPFDLEILSDDEKPPQAKLTIQNIDPRIGDSIRELSSPPRLKIELLSSADFDLTVDPRTENVGDNLGNLLLHCDGIDGSTTFEDSSGSAHTMTPNNVEIDTAQSKFGGASLRFNTTSATLTSDASIDFTFGTGDLTIDFWYRPVDSAQNNIFQIGTAGTSVIYKSAGADVINYYNGSTVITGTTVLTINTWYHIELTRSSGVTRLFINGVQEGSNYPDSTNYSTNQITLGQATFTSIGEAVDEVRVIKGTAAHVATFTPKTSEYSSASVTVIYSTDQLFLINVTVDIMVVSGTIVGWDYLQRVWPGQRATQATFPGLFR